MSVIRLVDGTCAGLEWMVVLDLIGLVGFAGASAIGGGSHYFPAMRIHLLVPNHCRMDTTPALYTIRINGHLGATVLMAFPVLASRQHGTHTVLTGPLDRSALYGVLTEVEALGLDLLEVRQLTPDCKSPGSGDNRSP